VLLIGSYLPYIVFDDWWYLRFLLPGLPLVFFFVVDVLWIASGPLGSTGRRVVAGVIAIAVASYGLAFALRKEVTVIGEGEQRHVDIGHFAGTKLPGNAVVLALLHSGSVRYYSGRPIVRYDMLAPESLGPAVAALESLNYSPFLVLDGGEEPEFRRRFKDQALAQQLDDRLIAAHDSRVPIRVYDLQSTAVPSAAAPAQVPHVPRLQCLDRPARLSSTAAAPQDRSAMRGGPASAWRAYRSPR
jgi:hypothetical protein